MKTFKTLAACALVAPLTLGAASVYAQGSPQSDRDQQQTETQRSTDERRSTDAQRQGMQQPGTTGHGDSMDRKHQTAGDKQHQTAGSKDYQAGGKSPLTRTPANAFHADWLMGKDLNAQVGDQSIGTVQDLVVDEDGQILAVIVGVGGLLGMGQREVAIPWDAIQHTRDQDGDSRFTTSMTQASLESAPEYDRDATGSGSQGATGTRRDASGTAPGATRTTPGSTGTTPGSTGSSRDTSGTTRDTTGTSRDTTGTRDRDDTSRRDPSDTTPRN